MIVYTIFMDRLTQIELEINSQSSPPVHAWKPEETGNIDICIDINANWYHEGEIIVRDKLVVLFSTILWFENGDHYLVTPVEKLKIDVVDVPFMVHQMECANNFWVVTTNTHESVIVGADHPVELRQFSGQWVPYVKIRYDLWARLNRSQYVQWVELALELRDTSGSKKLELSSGDYVFEVAKL